jgi:hypothetical protein
MKRILALVSAIILVVGIVGSASALTLVEDFEATFPAWETGWLGTNSNLQNYYGIGDDRGNNPDGLWLDDGDGIYGTDIAKIIFEPTFGSNLTTFDIDIAGYQGFPIDLQVYDMNGTIILNVSVTLTDGAYTDPGTYAHYSTTSTNGISAFWFIPIGSGQVEGNTSIDNVVVSAIPEPSTALLLAFGLVGIAAGRRRSRS